MDRSHLQSNAWELGCYLVDELGIADTCDTLSRWKVHHLAELIVSINNIIDENVAASSRELANKLIVELCGLYLYPITNIKDFIINNGD